MQLHPGLRERHIGVLQGLTNSEAPLQQPEAWAALQSGNHATRIPGGGESLNDLKERLRATLLGIAAQHPGGRCAGRVLGSVGVVCPGGTVENVLIARIEVEFAGDLAAV